MRRVKNSQIIDLTDLIFDHWDYSVEQEALALGNSARGNEKDFYDTLRCRSKSWPIAHASRDACFFAGVGERIFESEQHYVF